MMEKKYKIKNEMYSYRKEREKEKSWCTTRIHRWMLSLTFRIRKTECVRDRQKEKEKKELPSLECMNMLFVSLYCPND